MRRWSMIFLCWLTAICSFFPSSLASQGGGKQLAVRGTTFTLPPLDLKDSAQEIKKLWLDSVELIIGKLISLIAPTRHLIRGLFGISILFYGMDFKSLAFHIIIFRISGYKAVVKNLEELVFHYKQARQATLLAAKATKSTLAQLRTQSEQRRAMLEERRVMLRDGKITYKEAKQFLERHREELEAGAEEQKQQLAASSSLRALQAALPWKKILFTIRALYTALITSVTASTFKFAGQLTLTLYIGETLYNDILALAGPTVDPLIFDLELRSYMLDVIRGPANSIATLCSIAGTVSLIFLFRLEPDTALQICLCFLGANVLLDCLLNVLPKSVVKYKRNSRPVAVAHLMLTAIGITFHQSESLRLMAAICKPFIHLLQKGNGYLIRLKNSTQEFVPGGIRAA